VEKEAGKRVEETKRGIRGVQKRDQRGGGVVGEKGGGSDFFDWGADVLEVVLIMGVMGFWGSKATDDTAQLMKKSTTTPLDGTRQDGKKRGTFSWSKKKVCETLGERNKGTAATGLIARARRKKGKTGGAFVNGETEGGGGGYC